jgi:hypothetical protein
MIQPDVALAIATSLGWELVTREKMCYLISDATYSDGERIRIFLEQGNGQLLAIHDMANTFLKFRKQGQFTGRGRLATFIILCKAICDAHGADLHDERLVMYATVKDAPVVCRKLLNVIKAILPYSHPSN